MNEHHEVRRSTWLFNILQFLICVFVIILFMMLLANQLGALFNQIPVMNSLSFDLQNDLSVNIALIILVALFWFLFKSEKFVALAKRVTFYQAMQMPENQASMKNGKYIVLSFVIGILLANLVRAIRELYFL